MKTKIRKIILAFVVALGLITVALFFYINFKEKSCWNEAKTLNSSKGYAKYLASYPKGKYVTEANDSLFVTQKRENPLIVRIYERTGISYDSKGRAVEPGKVEEVKGYNEIKVYKKKGAYDYIQRIQFDGISDNLSILIENVNNQLIFSRNNFALKNDVVYSSNGFNPTGEIEQDSHYQKWMSDNRNGLLKIKVLYRNSLVFEGILDQRDQIILKKPLNNSEVKNKVASPSKVLNKNPTVTDLEGNVYKTIKIGTQRWMAENLKTTKYRNGDPIPNVPENLAWKSLTTGAYCWNNNNATSSKATYGALYNWFAVADSRNIAPTGWHVATDDDWTTLTTYLQGVNVAGGKLKETGFIHWSNPNIGASNSSGFTALPGGYRGGSGAFYGVGSGGIWWCSKVRDANNAWGRYLRYGEAKITRDSGGKNYGFSIRCVKD